MLLILSRALQSSASELCKSSAFVFCAAMEFHLGEKTSMFEKDDHHDGQQDVDGTRKVAKGHWTPEEDKTLLRCKEQHSNRAWPDIALELPGRTGKQCRERWINHLDPEIKKEPWTEAEELKLVECHRELGKKWAEIARCFNGRPENRIKNQWYATERRVEAKLKNKREDTSPGILEAYIHGLKEGEGKQGVLTGPDHAAGSSHKVTVALAGSNFTGSSQVPASGGNPFLLQPSFPDLNGDNDFPMETTYEDSLTLIPAKENDYLKGDDDLSMEATYEDSLTLIPAQENGYLNGDDDFPMEATYEDSLTLIPAQESGYFNVDEDFAVEPTYKDSLIPAPESGYLSYLPASGHQFGSAGDYLANNGLPMPPARANEEGHSSLNPPPAPGPGGYF